MNRVSACDRKNSCKAMINGITDHPELGTPDYEKALAQHAAYVETLKQCGVDVTVLPADEAYPIPALWRTRPLDQILRGDHQPRRSQPQGRRRPSSRCWGSSIPRIKIFHITDPGTLEGGDVMMCGDVLRGTVRPHQRRGHSPAGRDFEPVRLQVVAVPLTEVLHLKTGVVYLENNNMLTAGEFCTKPAF